jgi:hypothetical protein
MNEQQRDVTQQEAAVVETGKKEGVGGTMDQERGNAVKYLYTVRSKVSNVYDGDTLYEDGTLTWFCKGRDYPIMHPADGIEDYDKLKRWRERFSARDALNGLFSEEEAKALQDCLPIFKEFMGTTIEKVALPHTMDGISLLHVHMDRLVPNKYRNLDLPFEADAHLSLENAVKPKVCPACGREIAVLDLHLLAADGTPL